MTNDKGRFGTFGGVFTPNVLTILGVIMFLRFGQVVGQAGIVYAIAIIVLSKAITSLTAISLSAIATNTRVKGGGAYYLISRSLGVEFGGAIGIVFYLAQAVSVAMYVIGFTEAFINSFPNTGLSVVTVATVVNVLVFASVYVGAGWTIKLQYGILAILALSLLSFFAGAWTTFSFGHFNANLTPAFSDEQTFFTMFALFFPAATGIMAGANMSGDLKEPGKSIPAGTFSAIAVTGFIYLAMALMLGGSFTQSELKTNNFVVNDAAWQPMLIVAGVFAATLSSALGSMMGAPRILQALARDEIFGRLRFMAKGSGVNNEPRRATVMTFAVAQVAILQGDLDVIAPIITMFFMVTYGLLNLACFYEGYSKNPSFRPRFRYNHWSLALVGALGCLAAMLLISPLWAVAAVVVMSLIHWYVSRAEIQARWGDVQFGIKFEHARKSLLKLEDEKYHPKNWRPIILTLSGGTWVCFRLTEFGYWLAAGHGVLFLAQVISGDVDENRLERRRQAERRLRQFIDEEDLAAFPAVVVETDLLEGVKSLLQCAGIGGVRPNTVAFGWSEHAEEPELFGRMLRTADGFGCSVLIVDCSQERENWMAPTGTIDVWWQSRNNGSLMLTLAHMLVQNPEFRNRKIRILHTVPNEAGRESAREHFAEILHNSRIQGECEVFVNDDFMHEVLLHSKGAAVVFLGFNLPEKGEEQQFHHRYAPILREVDNVILAHGTGDIDLEA